MPNLQADPQNPSDLLGQPIANGDVVAWSTAYGQSVALCVAVIEKIKFTRQINYKRKECPQSEATGYRLRVRPIASTGSITWVDKRADETRPSGLGGAYYVAQEDLEAEPDRYVAKCVTIQRVDNIVRLDGPARDAALAKEPSNA